MFFTIWVLLLGQKGSVNIWFRVSDVAAGLLVANRLAK